MYRVCKKEGISLIEVLIALSLISVISILSVRGTMQGFNINKRVLKNSDYYHLLRTTFRHFEKDVLLAFHSYLDTDYGEYLREMVFRDEIDDYKETSFFIGTRDKLSFSTSSHKRMYKNSKETNIVEVSYFVSTDSEDARISNLYKRESIYVDDDFENGGKAYVLLKDIDDVEFKYFDKQGYDNEAKWLDKWNSLEGENKNIMVLLLIGIKTNFQWVLI